MGQENSSNAPVNPASKMLIKLQVERFSRYFLFAVVIFSAILFYQIMQFFLVPVFLAAIFSGLLFPLYEQFLKWTRQNKGLSSFLTCLFLLLVIIVPFYFVIDVVRVEAIHLYQTHEKTIVEFRDKVDSGTWGKIVDSTRVKYGINLEEFDLVTTIKTALTGIGNFLVAAANKTWQGTFQFLMNFLIMFFTLYYFFKDGERLINYLKYLSPLKDEHEDRLIAQFNSISRATVKGTMLIGLTQGGLGALLLWIFGFKSPVVFGVVMFILSVIPMVGGWLVLYPAAIYELVLGHYWQGLVIIIFTAVIISNVDNFMRPKLVGRDTGMHDLLIFFSSIGGIYVFGVMGFIIGPIITVLFMTIMDIYKIEFKEQLDMAQGIVQTEKTTTINE
ncbi:MAG: AI-2E family transporter [Deferribacteres bacterium]|nr:AI-2E family transporter [candidate division KSB1 bacterium]MCB9501571.1 AI-2E family transporter [Deferribacteres bacterium]